MNRGVENVNFEELPHSVAANQLLGAYLYPHITSLIMMEKNLQRVNGCACILSSLS